MNLQQLRYFHKIAALKNYTKASEELFVAQSSLSHSMAKLEHELGVPLFIKQGRNIVVTSYGENFDKHVAIILRELELAKNEIQQASNKSQGTVRLTVSHTLHHHFLPSLMKQYKSIPEFEKVQFQVSDLESTESGIAQMAAREVDLGFGAKVEQAGCCYFEVMSEELVAVVPINHPFAQKENITMQELCQEPLITYNHKCGTRYDLEHFFHKYGVSPQQIFEAQNEKMIASMVSAGIGVGIIPPIQEIGMYQVAVVPLENHNMKRSLYMFWLEENFRPPVVESFRKFVIRTIQNKNI